jgi:Protein of unknown function (DUF1161)
MLRAPFAAVLIGLAAPAAAASNCESVRAQIEAKIRAAGVAVFSVTVVDAAAPHAGKVVGNCGAGSKKIVYQQGQSASMAPMAPASAASAAPRRGDKPRAAAVITECKDGSVLRDGNCVKKAP